MVIFVTYGDHANPMNGGAKFTASFISLLEYAGIEFKVVNYYEINNIKNKFIRKVLALLRLVFMRIPLPVGYFYSARLLNAIQVDIEKLLEEGESVTLIADHLEMSYVFDLLSFKDETKLRRLHLSHNNEPVIFKEHFKFKFFYNIFNLWANYAFYEEKVFDKLDCVLSISATETELYKKKYPDLMSSCIPPLFSYAPLTPSCYFKEHKKIIFAADFSWYPNFDAYVWINENLLPELPDTYKLYIYGLNQNLLPSPDPEFKDKVVFCGYVDDVLDIWTDAYFSLAPMRQGAGINIKLAESLHNKIPVIASALAVEGIEPKMLHGVVESAMTAQSWIDILEMYTSDDLYRGLVNDIAYVDKNEYVEVLREIIEV